MPKLQVTKYRGHLYFHPPMMLGQFHPSSEKIVVIVYGNGAGATMLQAHAGDHYTPNAVAEIVDSVVNAMIGYQQSGLGTFRAEIEKLMGDNITLEEIERLDRMAYDYSGARIPMSVGEARRTIFATLQAHPMWNIDQIADEVWKT